jgi:hypothetical protein
MLNFAEQTGSGAVIVVWSFLMLWEHTSIYTAQNFRNLIPHSRLACLGEPGGDLGFGAPTL